MPHAAKEVYSKFSQEFTEIHWFQRPEGPQCGKNFETCGADDAMFWCHPCGCAYCLKCRVSSEACDHHIVNYPSELRALCMPESISAKDSPSDVGEIIDTKRNKRVTQILDEFCALNRLDSTCRDPIRSQKQTQKEPQPEEFANYLGDVFRSDVGHNASVLDMLNVFASSHGLHSIPPFQLPELEYALSQMSCNKATDATGVVVEMFKHGNVELHTCLLNIFLTVC